MKNTISNCNYISKIQIFKKYLHALGLEIKQEQDDIVIFPLPRNMNTDISHGKIQNAMMMSSLTEKPERDGLYCERIFNSAKNYKCFCYKYRGKKHNKKICERCGVEVAEPIEFHKREGHISLAHTIINPLFMDYLAAEMKTDPDLFRDIFYYKTLHDPQDFLEILQKNSRTRNLIINKLLVPPGGLRPHKEQQIQDINTLYKEVIVQNNRLQHFIKLSAPKAIIQQEIGALQQKVDSLFINEHLKTPFSDYRKKRYTYTSLLGYLQKQMHLVFATTKNFDGKCIATYNPKIPENQCYVPLRILLSLYNNFIAEHFATTRSRTDTKNIIENIIRGDKEFFEEIHATLLIETAKRPLILAFKTTATALYPLPHNAESIALPKQACQQLKLTMQGEKISFYLPKEEKANQQAIHLSHHLNNNSMDSIFWQIANMPLPLFVDQVTQGQKLRLLPADLLYIKANQLDL